MFTVVATNPSPPGESPSHANTRVCVVCVCGRQVVSMVSDPATSVPKLGVGTVIMAING